MANTIDSGLVKQLLNDDKVVTTLGTKAAPLLDKLSVQLEVDGVAPGASINVPVVSAGPTVQTNATDFQSGNSTVDNCQVAAAQKTASFHLTNAQANAGYSLLWLLKKAAQQLRNSIVDVVLAPVTTTNFGTAALDSTAADFDSADLKTIWAGGNGKNFDTHNLLLDGGYYAKLLPTSAESFRPEATGAYGFDSIQCHNRWDGAGSGVIGFHFDGDAIAVGLGFPAMNDDIRGDMLASYDVMIEQIGLPVQFNQWVDRQSRAMWASLDIMIGAKAADKTAGELITDGAS